MKKTFLLWGCLMGMSFSLAAQEYSGTVLDEAKWTDTEHNFQGDGYAAADPGATWVNATTAGTWFSYDLSLENVDANQPLYLAFDLWTGDFNGRETAIYIDDELVVDRMAKPAQFAQMKSIAYMRIPGIYWKAADGTPKKQVTVKVTGIDGRYSFGIYSAALVQNIGYTFNPEDWKTCDTGRLQQENITYDNEAKTIVAKSAGLNNIALGLSADGKYTIPASCKYMVICGEGLKTDANYNDSYMWWLNGRNNNSQEAPLFKMQGSDGKAYLVWNITKTGISDNICGNPVVLTNYGQAHCTIFGLTSSNEDGSATISDIGFYSLDGIAEKYPELAEKMAISQLSEENAEETVEVNGCATVKRTLKPFVWNTFCMPFDMDAATLKENGIINVKQLNGAVVNAQTATLDFKDVETVSAGVPYVVKVDDNVSVLNVDATANVKASPEPQEAIEGLTMVGNYGMKTISGNEFFIRDNAFYCADAAVTVRGFRACIVNGTANRVNRMMIDIDGIATSVEDAVCDWTEDAPANVYTLSGVCVKKGARGADALEGLPKGIYIVNGKKLMK